MASTIAALTSGAGGISMTGDASGILNLNSNGTNVVAVTSTGVAVTGTLSASNGISVANTFGFKNRIINGGMVIDQRNAGASVTPVDQQYLVDRWTARLSQSSKFSAQQNAGSVTPPAGFTNYQGITSSSAYSVGASDYFLLRQIIEGYNVADLSWGTANAKTVTLSFQVYSSLTGAFGGSLQNSASNRSYPFTYTVSSANTWTPVSVTVAGDTSGTWATNNTTGIILNFGLGVGSTFSGTAGSWAGPNYLGATGAVSVVGTSGATFYITGVQLEKGSTATSFDFRAYSTELEMCQRYLPAFNAPGGAEGLISAGQSANATVAANTILFPVSTRVPPTGISSPAATKFKVLFAVTEQAGTAIAFSSRATTLSAQVNLTVASGLTAGQALSLAWGTTSTSTDVLYFTGCEL
jgi:hypothetical protein